MSNERFVFDSNVLISALLFESSKPGRALSAAIDRGSILISQPVIKEISAVLGREKFDRYIIREERERFLGALLREAVLVEIAEQIRICRDPRDDKFLELAASGEATVIVTGDKDLLVLRMFRDIPIITPDEFLNSL